VVDWHAPMLVVLGVTDPLTYANTEWDSNQTCNAFPDLKAILMLYADPEHNIAARVL
jgi:hypothetical protein